MKSKIILVSAALLSLSAVAIEPETIVLRDGLTAKVLSQNGTFTKYINGASETKDGKVILTQGEVFDGERLVKTADGKCFTVQQHLVRLDNVSVGEMNMQLPTTDTVIKSASCDS
ncbi:hypothetical protein [Polaromonas sp.]|uniref:hypothetical protein n=1 Tax=Polaromonas sp. TaxID=1869339 RepID=UPI003529F9D2